MKQFLILFLYIIITIPIMQFALLQNQSKNDSLENLLTISKDTSRIRILNELASNYRRVDTVKAGKYAIEALNLATKLEDKRGTGSALHNLASLYMDKGLHDSALQYYLKSIKLNEEIGNKKGIVSSLFGIGNMYDVEGKYNKALEYYYKTLEINEEIGDKRATAFSYLGIGNILSTLMRFEESIDFYERSIKLFEELNDPYVSWSLNNIATVYVNLNEYDKALEYHYKSLQIKEKEGDKYGIAFTLSSIGTVFHEKGDYEKALEFHQKSLKAKLEMEAEKETIAFSMLSIGKALVELDRYDKSSEYLEESLKIAKEINAKIIIKSCYMGYSMMFARKQDYKKAYRFYQLYSEINDSIYNEESSKQIAEMQTRYETEKKEKEIELLNNEKALQTSELNKQKIIIFSGAGGLLLVMALAFFIYRGYRHKQKANLLLEEKNKIIEKKNQDITQKNKDITDSIRYAERIQHAILTPKAVIDKIFKNYFILYKPKDIVSGDFYFFAEVGDNKIAIAADCTGHGVPGAFMSMIGNDMLNAIINDKSVTTPAMVLNELNKAIQRAVNIGKGEEDIKDGMDIAVCVFNTKTKELQYAGANNPLYIVRNGGDLRAPALSPHLGGIGGGLLEEVKPDKQPIGYWHGEDKPFTNHSIKLQKGDTIYITSDGYQDQFGGTKGKKFMSKQLRNLFLTISAMSMEEQKEHLNKTIEEWKGGRVQTDDICVIGILV